MGGGHITHNNLFKYAEINNRKKEEEKLEKEKLYRNEIELHETDALKVFEHVTEKGVSIDQCNNKQLEILLL